VVRNISSAGMTSLTKSAMLVSTNPGQKATDLIPSALSYLFIARVYAMTAALVAA
jgi:hypothetical protein